MSAPRIIPTREAYAAWAEAYDGDDNATRDLDAARLRADPPPLAGARLVEIGAGTGKNTLFYAEHAAHVTAIDLSEAMLARARDKLDGAPVGGATVDWRVHDIRKPWPLESGAYDGVAAHLVLEHVEAIIPVLAEAARVLKPGGFVYLSEFHPFRQMRGGRARFDGAEGPAEVEAYAHSIAEFVSAGLAAGLSVTAMGEWLEDRPDAATTPPRLLTIRFRKD